MSLSAGISALISAVTGNTLAKVLCGLVGGLLIAALLAGAVRYVYNRGFEAADSVRRADIAELQKGHAKALAKAEAEARARLEAATARTNDLESRYLAARRTIQKQSRELTNQRITHASSSVDISDGSCRFGPEWVRLYNEAIGAGSGDGGDAVPGTIPGPAGEAGTGAPVDAGILSTVTPEDILAHVRDYGQRNQAMEAQLNALIEWATGLNDTGAAQ